jgi:hypothetical protein
MGDLLLGAALEEPPPPSRSTFGPDLVGAGGGGNHDRQIACNYRYLDSNRAKTFDLPVARCADNLTETEKMDDL